jgi:aryl-alcohol dehydrogenase-like predicted oxidoreductase
VLGLGCAQWGRSVDEATAERLVRAGLDEGVTLFDTADTYGGGASEETLGRALRGVRDRVVVATKFRWATGKGPNDHGASRVHLRAAVEASLRRLGTDRIDLYQLHAPDPGTPIEETLAALDDLVTAGKVLYTGSANFPGWRLVDADLRAAAAGRTAFAGTQVPYSLLDRRAEAEVLPAARHCGVGVLACLVLGRGYLAGSFDESTDPAGLSTRRRGVLTAANRAAAWWWRGSPRRTSCHRPRWRWPRSPTSPASRASWPVRRPRGSWPRTPPPRRTPCPRGISRGC